MRRATKKAIAKIDAEGISIHALREEGDHSFKLRLKVGTEFQSTPSVRRATI